METQAFPFLKAGFIHAALALGISLMVDFCPKDNPISRDKYTIVTKTLPSVGLDGERDEKLNSPPVKPSPSFNLEERFRQEGIDRFYGSERKTIQKNVYAISKVGQRISVGVIEPVASAIETFVVHALEGKPTQAPGAAKYLAYLDPKVVAVILIRRILDTLTKPVSFTSLAVSLGRLFEHELLLVNFAAQQKRLYEVIRKDVLRRIKNTHFQRRVLKQQALRWRIESLSLDTKTAALVGGKLIELFTEATGLIEVKTLTGGSRQQHVVYPSESALALVKSLNGKLFRTLPVLGPITQKPKEWVRFDEGGFHELKQPFVRTRSRAHADALRVYAGGEKQSEGTHNAENQPTLDSPTRSLISHALGHLMTSSMTSPWTSPVTSHPMAKAYQAVNILQSTPYRINTKVLDVARALWDRGLALGGLPEKYDPKVHGLPTGFGQNSFKEFEKHQRIKSKNLEIHLLLKTAEGHRGEPNFYFVHNVDFRGRVYPVTSYLSPQGNDLNRGLLTFAEDCGKLVNPDGEKWLSIHTANCWGLDKKSFHERIQWAKDSYPRILQIAKDPLSDYWWTEADKPFQFLACCFEWLGFREQGETYRCSLPVTVDGSNNALQHFSALLLDEELGKATNMVPQNMSSLTVPLAGPLSGSPPRDFYQEVCEGIKDILQKESTKETPMAVYARVWLPLLNRKLVKGPVMNYYYGVTPKGMEEQIEDSLREQGLTLDLNRLREKRECIGYLVKLLREVIPQKAPSVEACMELLKKTTRFLARKNQPTSWITPSGFKVIQDNRKNTSTLIGTQLFGKQQFKMRINQEGLSKGSSKKTKIDIRKQANGISANFIHSLDASALTLCVLKAQKEGIQHIRTIHDSFSVVPSDMELLSQCIRSSFKQMYLQPQGDLSKGKQRQSGPLHHGLLQGLLTQVLAPEVAQEFWDTSKIQMGRLNLSDLEKAPYFFG